MFLFFQNEIMHECLIYDTHSANLTSFTPPFYSYITSGLTSGHWVKSEQMMPNLQTLLLQALKKRRPNYTAFSPGLGIEHSDIYKQSIEVQTIIDPMLRMGKLRFPEVKSLAQNHFALKKDSESHFSIELHHSK